jgi:tRNA pseudouridine13 synthase
MPDPDRTQRVDDRRVDTVARHSERERAFVTAPLVGTDSELAAGEPGEIERAILRDLGIERGDFDLPGEFHSEGTRRAIQIRTTVDVAPDPESAVDGDDVDALEFAFALPSGSYATTVLREYCKVDPLQLT